MGGIIPIQGGHGNIEFLMYLEKRRENKAQYRAAGGCCGQVHKEFKDEYKNIRLEKIRRFIRDHEVGDPRRDRRTFVEEGISANQATVSRDIKELGIVKRPLKKI